MKFVDETFYNGDCNSSCLRNIETLSWIENAWCSNQWGRTITHLTTWTTMRSIWRCLEFKQWSGSSTDLKLKVIHRCVVSKRSNLPQPSSRLPPPPPPLATPPPKWSFLMGSAHRSKMLRVSQMVLAFVRQIMYFKRKYHSFTFHCSIFV